MLFRSPSSAALQQKPLTAVPTDCPSPDAISISVKVSLPSVDSNSDAGTLECTYFNPSVSATALVITFGPSEGATPAEFDQQVLAANPSAVAVPGVGDAALYFTHQDVNPPIGNMNFLSGAVFGYVYGNLSFATQEHLTALIADQILVP